MVWTPTEIKNEVDDRFWEMYHSPIVPSMEEPADTQAGELLRAVGIVIFRYFSYGEMVGGDWGTEYVNPAARFVLEMYPDTEPAATVKAFWGVQWSETYRKGIVKLTKDVMDFISENDEMLTEDNEWDCLEFDEPEDRQCEEDEEEDEWGGKSQREIDLAEYPPLDWRR